MKCFLVYVKEWDYDTYDGVVVAADSEEEVRSMFHYDKKWKWTTIGDGDCPPRFEDFQGEILIEEVKEKGVVLASYNAG